MQRNNLGYGFLYPVFRFHRPNSIGKLIGWLILIDVSQNKRIKEHL